MFAAAWNEITVASALARGLRSDTWSRTYSETIDSIRRSGMSHIRATTT